MTLIQDDVWHMNMRQQQASPMLFVLRQVCSHLIQGDDGHSIPELSIADEGLAGGLRVHNNLQCGPLSRIVDTNLPLIHTVTSRKHLTPCFNASCYRKSCNGAVKCNVLWHKAQTLQGEHV